MSEQGSDPGPRGMYSRAFRRAEAEAAQPARVTVPQVETAPVMTTPIPHSAGAHAIEPRVPRPRRQVKPRRPRIASRPLEPRAAMAVAAALVLAGALAPLAISDGHADPESSIAAGPAVQIGAAGDVELPLQEVAAAAAPVHATAAATNREPAGSPAPRAPGRIDGGLLVESEPAGARVTVNGIGYGETPLRIGYLPFGMKRVRIIKEGYASVERTVRVEAASPRPRVRITLREQK